MSQNWGGGGNWGGGYGAPPGPGGTVPGSPFGPGHTQPGGFAPPPPGYPPGYTPMPSGGVVAWEDKSLGLFGRWWGTFKEVAFNPKRFYEAAAQNDDPWPAVTFSVTNGAIVGLVMGLFFALIYVAIGGLGAAFASSGGKMTGPAAGIFGVIAAVGVGVGIVVPLLLILTGFLSPWIAGGLHHLGLAMVGGTSRPYSSTVRVVGYASAAQIFSFFPGAGGILSIGLMIVYMVIGFEQTHRCGTGKAVFGALWTWLLICVCYCGCYALLGFMTAAAGHR